MDLLRKQKIFWGIDFEARFIIIRRTSQYLALDSASQSKINKMIFRFLIRKAYWIWMSERLNWHFWSKNGAHLDHGAHLAEGNHLAQKTIVRELGHFWVIRKNIISNEIKEEYFYSALFHWVFNSTWHWSSFLSTEFHFLTFWRGHLGGVVLHGKRAHLIVGYHLSKYMYFWILIQHFYKMFNFVSNKIERR